jgi:hypothetical protein
LTVHVKVAPNCYTSSFRKEIFEDLGTKGKVGQIRARGRPVGRRLQEASDFFGGVMTSPDQGFSYQGMRLEEITEILLDSNIFR